MDIATRMRAAAADKALDIGTAWEMLAQGADALDQLRAEIADARAFNEGLATIGRDLEERVERLLAALREIETRDRSPVYRVDHLGSQVIGYGHGTCGKIAKQALEQKVEG